LSFPIEPQVSEPESDFLIQDPFGLRRAITPFFAFDLSDGMFAVVWEGWSREAPPYPDQD
jgi:hypothetical protein